VIAIRMFANSINPFKVSAQSLLSLSKYQSLLTL